MRLPLNIWARSVPNSATRRAQIAGSLLTLALIAALGACDDDEAASTTAVDTVEATTPTDAPNSTSITTTTTTSPPTTTTVPETSPTTTPPPSTPTTAFPPAPTIYPPTDPRAEVERAYIEGLQAWIGCFATLPNCDVATIQTFTTGQALEVGTHLVNTLQAEGFTATRTNEYLNIVRGVEMVSPSTAVVRSCDFDPVRIARAATESSPEMVFSDTIISSENETTMLLGSDGRWRNDHTDETRRVTDGSSICTA